MAGLFRGGAEGAAHVGLQGKGGFSMADWVTLMGVKGGPAIRPGSNMPTSILVSLGGQRILVDAGLGAARGVCDAGVALADIDAILITHLHSDHYLELGPLLHTAWTAGLCHAMPIWGPPGLVPYWEGFLASMNFDIQLRIADEGRPDLSRLAELHPVTPGQPIEIGAVRVDAMENVHPPVTPSYAFRLSAGEKTIVLSGDTAAMAEMESFAFGADLLVHEAMLTDGVDAVVAQAANGDDRLRTHILRSHTSAEDAGHIAAKSNVRRLALNHFVPDGMPSFTDRHWHDAVRTTWDGDLILGRDGLRIDL